MTFPSYSTIIMLIFDSLMHYPNASIRKCLQSAGILIVLSTSQSSIADNLIETPAQHIATCGAQYPKQELPQPLTEKNVDLYYLCFDGFAIGYSGVSKTALWSAEHLTRERIEKANELERVNSFHEESRLPDSAKAYLSDYHNVTYDRGHLAPNGDMATPEQQYDSFSLANIIPQNPKNNRDTWRSLESRTRYLALKHGEIYVVTGTAFLGKTSKKINQHIVVPSHLYKAIYIPSLGQAGVYYVPNDDSRRVEIISLNELALRTGMDVMPGVAPQIQNVAMPLPMDTVNPSANDKTRPHHNTDDTISLIIKVLMAVLQWLLQLFN